MVLLLVRQLVQTPQDFAPVQTKEHSDLLDIAVFLQDQLNRYGMLHGYKMMHLKCIQAVYVVTQETIRQLLKILDPMECN